MLDWLFLISQQDIFCVSLFARQESFLKRIWIKRYILKHFPHNVSASWDCASCELLGYVKIAVMENYNVGSKTWKQEANVAVMHLDYSQPPSLTEENEEIYGLPS